MWMTVAEYSAFLLPNPYRLIIDIHGKLPPNNGCKQQESQTHPRGNQICCAGHEPTRSRRGSGTGRNRIHDQTAGKQASGATKASG